MPTLPCTAANPLELGPAEVEAALATGIVVLDLRSLEELGMFGIPAARHAPMAELLAAPERFLAPEQEAVLVCERGVRSGRAVAELRARGWRQVRSLAGGLSAWRAHGAARAGAGARAIQHERYLRQLRLPQVGEHGQQRLARATVALVGLGGLGSPIAWYLAAAGVGHLRLIDPDRVERSNLQRQILYRDADVGAPKIEVARERLSALNPELHFELCGERLDQSNAVRLLDQVDVVIDGSDNFPTRYAINRACLERRTPWVYGAVERFQGEVAVFDPREPDAPCYACLYPQQDAAPGLSCAEAGVLGVLPGLIGCWQALEAIKLILGVGRPLLRCLLRLDGLSLEQRLLQLSRDPGCAACGG